MNWYKQNQTASEIGNSNPRYTEPEPVYTDIGHDIEPKQNRDVQMWIWSPWNGLETKQVTDYETHGSWDIYREVANEDANIRRNDYNSSTKFWTGRYDADNKTISIGHGGTHRQCPSQLIRALSRAFGDDNRIMIFDLSNRLYEEADSRNKITKT
jgi:hypothetical protein